MNLAPLSSSEYSVEALRDTFGLKKDNSDTEAPQGEEDTETTIVRNTVSVVEARCVKP